MIDIAVIGCGPAGLSAAINAWARNKSVIVFGNKIDTGALYKTKKIDNHLGMPNESGKDMMEKFLTHALNLNIEIKNGRVLQILSMGKYFVINFENEFFNAKTVIIAVGITKTKKIPGEEKFLGNGVSYCATCDGMFYKNKSVAVVADSVEAESDVRFLSGICKNVIYLPMYDLKENFPDNVEIIHGKPNEILGDDSIKALKIDNKEIVCDGIFFINENTPVDNIIFGLELNGSIIKVNCLCETNLPGVFAAGDCTGWPFQLSKAIGQGQVAAQNAAKFIDSMKQ